MPSPPSPEAWDLVSVALGRALDEVAATGGPLAPVVLHRSDQGTELQRFRAATLDKSLAKARRTLAAGAATPWVLVWDGYFTLDGWRTDALYAHVELDEHAPAHLFVWRYGLLDDGTIGPLAPTSYLGPDGRYDSPERSHPLPSGEGPTSPHGEVLPRRRSWWRRGD